MLDLELILLGWCYYNCWSWSVFATACWFNVPFTFVVFQYTSSIFV